MTVNMQGRGGGKVLIVCPGPTTADDISGILMSGGLGISLTSLMADAGFAETEWRVTGAIRCAGVPTTTEIDACRDYLKEEIHEIQPSVIVAMGDIALRSLCRRSGLVRLRGGSIPLHSEFGYSVDVYPTHSPAYLLVSPKARPSVVTDLRRVRDRLKEDDDTNYRIEDNINEWSTEGPLAFDIETDFFVSGGERIVQVAGLQGYGTGLQPAAIVARQVPTLVRGGPLIGHNSWGFDVPVLRRNGAIVPSLGDDTMVLAYLDDESQPRGLEALAVKYLGVKGWKEGLHAEIGSEEFAKYNARDAINTYRLWEVLSQRLGLRKRIHDHIMRPAFEAFAACSGRGLFISQRVAAEVDAKYSEERERLASSIKSRTGIKNPNSPAQVSRYFFGDSKRSSDTASLLRYIDSPVGDPVRKRIARDTLDYRHATKMLSTFIRPYQKLGRIHFPYNILGTDSGRVSARHHNMPRELKGMFGAPAGSCLVSVDYAAIEFRFAAWVAGVKNVLDRYALDPNFDPHRWFGGHFYEKEESGVSRDERQTAKSGNFGLLFKSSAKGLAGYAFKTSGIHMSLRTAENIRQKWLELLPEIPTFWDQTETFLRKNGYVESVTGRRRNFGDPRLLPRPGGAWNEMVRQGINHLIQSPCTDIAQTGLLLCHRAGLPVNGFFHDSVTFEFDSEEQAKAVEPTIERLLTQDTFQYLRENFGVNVSVPFTVEFAYTIGE